MSKSVKKIIPTAKFNHLKKFEGTLTDEERQEIEEYIKSRHKVNVLPKGYFDDKPKRPSIARVRLNWLKKKFIETWQKNERKELILTDENKPIYRLIAEYFAKHKDFEKTGLTENIASLDKGLLIIGGVGCGKTSMLRAFYEIGREIYDKYRDTFMLFRMISCNSLVREYENLEQQERDFFFKKYINGTMYFDDFGTEPEASNFGKRNLMKDILEERYLKEKKCYLTTNLTLNQIEEKYGFRVYDRIKEAFNVIIMDGKSFRK